MRRTDSRMPGSCLVVQGSWIARVPAGMSVSHRPLLEAARTSHSVVIFNEGKGFLQCLIAGRAGGDHCGRPSPSQSAVNSARDSWKRSERARPLARRSAAPQHEPHAPSQVFAEIGI